MVCSLVLTSLWGCLVCKAIAEMTNWLHRNLKTANWISCLEFKHDTDLFLHKIMSVARCFGTKSHKIAWHSRDITLKSYREFFLVLLTNSFHMDELFKPDLPVSCVSCSSNLHLHRHLLICSCVRFLWQQHSSCFHSRSALEKHSLYFKTSCNATQLLENRTGQHH